MLNFPKIGQSGHTGLDGQLDGRCHELEAEVRLNGPGKLLWSNRIQMEVIC